MIQIALQIKQPDISDNYDKLHIDFSKFARKDAKVRLSKMNRNRTKRFLLVIFVFAVLMAMQALLIPRNAYGTSEAESLAAVAESQIGYQGSNNKGGHGDYTKYGVFTGTNGQYWCASFVAWCADKAGVSIKTVPKSASTLTMAKGSDSYRAMSEASFASMKRGDVIFFSSMKALTNARGEKTVNHVGIVASVVHSSRTLQVVKGNTSSDIVHKNKYSFNPGSGYIAGDGRYFCGYISVGDATPVVTNLKYEFNSQGGSGSYSAIVANKGDTFTLPTAKPTKTGYVFKGWAVKRLGDQKWFSAQGGWVSAGQVASKGGYKLYSAGKTLNANNTWLSGFTGSTAKYRFYAQWAPATVTYKFSLRGGSGTFKNITATYGGSFTLPATKPTRTDYVFKGWAVKRLTDQKWFSADSGWVASSQVASNGGFKLYAAGKKLSMNKSWFTSCSTGYSNFRFYAQWEKSAATNYVYEFDLNDGVGDSDEITAPLGSTFTLPDKPVKAGYTLQGWAVKRLPDQKWFSADSGWVEADSLDASGGYKLYSSGKSLNANETWTKNCSYTGTTVKFRFYAIWKAFEATFRFDLRDGVGSADDIKATYGGSFTLPSAAPTKSGYTFKGWAVKRLVDQKYYSANSSWVLSDQVKSNGGFKLYAAGSTLSLNSPWFNGCAIGYSNFRFYAQWEKNADLVECSFDYLLNGGVGSFDSVDVAADSNLVLASEIPTRDGYTFKGWALKRVGDAYWMTANGGWRSKAEVAANGSYKLYAAGAKIPADDSLMEGFDGNSRQFKLYAQWAKVL